MVFKYIEFVFINGVKLFNVGGDNFLMVVCFLCN